MVVEVIFQLEVSGGLTIQKNFQVSEDVQACHTWQRLGEFVSNQKDQDRKM